MPELQKIHFREVRGFTELFNASINFIRQNFGHFFRCLLFIAGPFLLLTGICTAYYQKTIIQGQVSYMESAFGNPFAQMLSKVFSWMYFAVLLLTLLGSLALMGTVYEYMLLYNAKGPRNFTVNDVGRALWRDAGNIIWTFCCMFFWSLVFGAVIVLIYVGFYKLSPGLGVAMTVMGFIGLLLIIFPLMYYTSSIYMVRINERIGFLEAASRALYLLKGSYWWTWVIFICIYFMLGFITGIFAVPQAILQGVVTFSSVEHGVSDNMAVVYLILTSATAFFSSFIYFVMMVFTGFHYFSLTEKKEGTGLLERIDEIGTRKDTAVEGEY